MNPSELQLAFASNIKKFRKLNNLTQMKLAEIADLSIGYICDLEGGKKWGTPETITKLSEALKIQPYQLFFVKNDIDNKNSIEEIHKDLVDFSNDLKTTIDFKISEIIRKYNLN